MNEVCSICNMIKHNVFDEFNTHKYDLLPRGSLDQKHSWTEIISTPPLIYVSPNIHRELLTIVKIQITSNYSNTIFEGGC